MKVVQDVMDSDGEKTQGKAVMYVLKLVGLRGYTEMNKQENAR